MKGQELWFAGLVILSVAVFQIFTREYVNLTSIAFNFWATSGSLSQILFNQIVFHLGASVGCIVPICASLAMETSDQCWLLMMMSVILMIIDQLAGLPQLLTASMFGLFQAALGLLQAQLICEYLPPCYRDLFFQMSVVGRSIAGLVYNNEFSQSGLLNFSNTKTKQPFSDANFYSGFVDAVFALVALGVFILARQQIGNIRRALLMQLRARRKMRRNLRFSEMIKISRMRAQPHAIILGCSFIGLKALSTSAWPCLIVFLEQKYSIQNFSVMIHLYWLAQVIAGLLIPELQARFSARPLYIISFGLALALVYVSYIFTADVSQLMNLHAILLGIVSSCASTCTCALISVYLKKTVDINRFFNELNIWLNVFSVCINIISTIALRYEDAAFEIFPACCFLISVLIVAIGVWYTWWDVTKQRATITLA